MVVFLRPRRSNTWDCFTGASAQIVDLGSLTDPLCRSLHPVGFQEQKAPTTRGIRSQGVIVLTDIAFTCIDIDSRTAGRNAPAWVGVASTGCLILYAAGPAGVVRRPPESSYHSLKFG